MKTAFKIIIAINLCFFALGIGMRLLSIERYEVAIGLGMLFLSFVLMPFFLFYRYDTKRMLKKK